LPGAFLPICGRGKYTWSSLFSPVNFFAYLFNLIAT
jgi:hypothetical protein